MLALCRPRCPLHSCQLSQVRTLRSFPRKIPGYIRGWNPTPPSSSSTPDAANALPPKQSTDDVDPSKPPQQKDLNSAPHEWYGIRQADVQPPHMVRKFQYLLQQASSKRTTIETLRAPLWRAYVLAKKADPELIWRMSEADWEILHKSQVTSAVATGTTSTNATKLLRDMKAAGWPHVGEARARYLESMFFRGQKAKALRVWEEDDVRSRNGKQELKAEHLELGAKLHAYAGKLDRARTIMEELFSLYPDWSPAIMMTVFREHTGSLYKQDRAHARGLYIKMKERLGPNAKLRDYDNWLVGFLEAGDLESARQAFKEMIGAGHLVTAGSVENISEVLQRLHMLYKLGTDTQSTTEVALDALAVLPDSYHMHLFGDWMKAAVVQQAPEAAAQILDMMIQRGYAPESLHLNLLLRALLRSNKTSNMTRFENIGWRMVDAAPEGSRKTLGNPRSVLRQIMHRQKTPQIIEKLQSGNHALPAADAATFGLLLQYHTNKEEWEHVDYLARRLSQSGLKPNATILNVLVDIKCRQGYHSDAWAMYRKYTTPSSDDVEPIFPTGTTMRLLWINLRLGLGRNASRTDSNLPSPRELMMETNAWWEKCRSRPDAARFRLGFAGPNGGAIAPLMLHCFGYTNDLAGALIALNFLRHKCDIFPTEKEAEYLQRSIVWITNDPDLLQRAREVKAHSLARVQDLYSRMMHSRLERMKRRGIKTENMTQDQENEFRLNLQSELLRAVMLIEHEPEVVEAMIENAKRDMGLSYLQTGDMDAFDMALLGILQPEVARREVAPQTGAQTELPKVEATTTKKDNETLVRYIRK